MDPWELDRAAARLARRRGAVEVGLGEALARLFCGDRLLRLGYARQVDYARERLGVPPRTMYLWLRLARGLLERPLLRRAVLAGLVSPRKALAVFPVAVGAQEASWTAAAMRYSLCGLEAAVRAEGKEPDVDGFEAESLWLRMSPGQQDRLDAALSLAEAIEGRGTSRWRRLEVICQEWLGVFGAWCPEVAEPLRLPAGPVRVRLPPLEKAGVAEEKDPRTLDARILKLLAARRGFDEAFGRLVARIVGERLWAALGYRSLAEYCRERLSMAPRSVRERVWLERRMCALPPLREALSSGRLTYSKALLVARDATPADVAERIEEASCTTWQQLEREATQEEDRRNRAAGMRRLWGPRDAARTVVDAIAGAQAWSALRGSVIDAGEALAVVADHFVEVWTVHLKRMPRERRQVLMRHGGLCAVPGCSRPAEHEHHVTFRSRGGSDDLTNRVAVCAAHHLRAIHRGHLTVAGRAGERLTWKLGTGEVWVTDGDDDVRCVGTPSRRPRAAICLPPCSTRY